VRLTARARQRLRLEREQRLAMTPEEQRAADLSATEQQRLAMEQRKAAEEEMKVEAAFAASPPGLARSAFQRGDHVFQASFDLANTSTYHVLMKTGTWTSAEDPTAILNAICDEGWELITGSVVFHETGSQSRDKFMASGQHIAVQGKVIGYYLFRRKEENLSN
jgi:hypothetical protein